MTRRAAALVLALTFTPAVLYAQDATLTVTVPSADVHKGPSTVTPVIGHVSRGAALPVSRNLGSWIRIPWPSAPEGVGYMHVTMGRLSGTGPEPSATATRSTSASAPRSEAASTPAPVPTPPRARTPGERVGVQGAQGVTTLSHVIGIGGVIHSRGFGATGRAWHDDRLGVEFRLTRSAMTSATAAGRMTSVELEPRVVYALFDHVSDYVWVRPYVGSGLIFSHRTLTVSSPGPIDAASDNRVGFRVFGGGELTFASVTRFGLSAELGYRSPSIPFPGFEADRLGLSIAGHWYIR
jgi:hypothetical protein